MTTQKEISKAIEDVEYFINKAKAYQEDWDCFAKWHLQSAHRILGVIITDYLKTSGQVRWEKDNPTLKWEDR